MPVGAAAGFVAVTHYVSIAAGAPLTFLILDTGIGLLFVGVGTVAWLRRPTSRTGPLLVLSGALWSLGSYGPTGFVPAWALGFAFEGYYDVALALLALTFPADRLSRVGRAAMWGLAGGFALRGIGRLLLQDPPRTYPDDFPSGDLVNPFAVLENRAAFETVEVLANATIAILAIVVAFVAVRRLVRSSSLTRSVIGPVLVGSVVAMVFASFDAAEFAWTTATGTALISVPESLSGFAGWLIPAARATVPVAFLLGTLRLRSTAGPLATMAARLKRESSPLDVDDASRDLHRE